MSERRIDINPYGAICKVELELPWEQAEFIVEHGPSIIRAIKRGIELRKNELRRNEETRRLVGANAEKLRAEYAQLAEKAEAEITRRSNAPGQRSQIIKQLSLEYDLTVPTLTAILRFHKNRKQDAQRRKRVLDVISLHLRGFSNRDIGRQLELRTRVVDQVLDSETDLLKTLKQNLTSADGGAHD